VRDILLLNYPKSEWEKDGLGSFSKRELSQDEIAKEMETFERGINAGVIDQGDLNDLNQMRDSIGFSERTTPIDRMGITPVGEDIAPGDAAGGDPESETGQSGGDDAKSDGAPDQKMSLRQKIIRFFRNLKTR
jgi:hypothetical protein